MRVKRAQVEAAKRRQLHSDVGLQLSDCKDFICVKYEWYEEKLNETVITYFALQELCASMSVFCCLFVLKTRWPHIDYCYYYIDILLLVDFNVVDIAGDILFLYWFAFSKTEAIA